MKTIRKIQEAFGNDAMSTARIKEWCNCFKDSRILVDSESRSSTSRNDNVIEQVQTVVLLDRRITFREIANDIWVNIGKVHSILTENLGIKSVSVKFLPKLVTTRQKQ